MFPKFPKGRKRKKHKYRLNRKLNPFKPLLVKTILLNLCFTKSSVLSKTLLYSLLVGSKTSCFKVLITNRQN